MSDEVSGGKGRGEREKEDTCPRPMLRRGPHPAASRASSSSAPPVASDASVLRSVPSPRAASLRAFARCRDEWCCERVGIGLSAGAALTLSCIAHGLVVRWTCERRVQQSSTIRSSHDLLSCTLLRPSPSPSPSPSTRPLTYSYTRPPQPPRSRAGRALSSSRSRAAPRRATFAVLHSAPLSTSCEYVRAECNAARAALGAGCGCTQERICTRQSSGARDSSRSSGTRHLLVAPVNWRSAD